MSTVGQPGFEGQVGPGNQAVKLTWSQFSNNLRQSTEILRGNLSFTDISVAAEHKQISAHRFVLASGSAFFQKLLESGTAANSHVYLFGVKYVDLASILDFMYTGQVVIEQTRLQRFLSVAEELGIKGLVDEPLSHPNNTITADDEKDDNGQNVETVQEDDVMILSNKTTAEMADPSESPMTAVESCGLQHDHNYLAHHTCTDHTGVGDSSRDTVIENDSVEDTPHSAEQTTRSHMVEIPLEFIGDARPIKRSNSTMELDAEQQQVEQQQQREEKEKEDSTVVPCQVKLQKISLRKDIISETKVRPGRPRKKTSKRGRKRKVQSEPTANSSVTDEARPVFTMDGQTVAVERPRSSSSFRPIDNEFGYFGSASCDGLTASSGNAVGEAWYSPPEEDLNLQLDDSSTVRSDGEERQSPNRAPLQPAVSEAPAPAKRKRGRPSKASRKDVDHGSSNKNKIDDRKSKSGKVSSNEKSTSVLSEPENTPTAGMTSAPGTMESSSAVETSGPNREQVSATQPVTESGRDVRTEVTSPVRKKPRDSTAPATNPNKSKSKERLYEKRADKTNQKKDQNTEKDMTSNRDNQDVTKEEGAEKASNKENLIDKPATAKEALTAEEENDYQVLVRNERVANIVDVMLLYKNKAQIYACSICQKTFIRKKTCWLHIAKIHVVDNLQEK